MKTLKEPHESLPRLVDLLEYLAQPGLEEVWVLLDIKVRSHSIVRNTLTADSLTTTRKK
jgi:tubulin gamma